MKKIAIILTLMTLSLSGFSQSKEETQIWIAAKLNMYSYDKYGTWKYYFKNDLLVMEARKTDGSSLIQSIQFENIGGILKEEKGFNYWITLKCKDNMNCSYSATKKDDTFSNRLMYPSFEILLKKSFMNDKLPERMTKALNHLIELNGGDVIKETF